MNQSATKEEDRIEEVSLPFLFWTFLKIGSVAFGGFMALISVIESIVVEKHRLLAHKDMLDGISLANLLPGPMAVNVVAFVGYRLRGAVGALIAAVGVILPSFIFLLILSYLYFEYGEIAQIKDIFKGLIPAVAAIILSVSWRLGTKTIKGKPELFLAISAAVAFLLVPTPYKIYTTLLIIGGYALIGVWLFKADKHENNALDKQEAVVPIRRIVLSLSFLSGLVLLWFFPLPLANDSLILLGLTFASMSLMLFGGGFVFIPIIGSIVVLNYGWVTQQEFTDGIALGQVTPGPILISAAFIGYNVKGFIGAIVATVAIFTPPAILMCTMSHALDFLNRSRTTQAAMHAIRCGVIGMIAVASYTILKDVLPSSMMDIHAIWPVALILVASLVALIKYNIDVVWVIPVSGLLGFLLF